MTTTAAGAGEKQRGALSPEHRESLARGRHDGIVVRRYLTDLAALGMLREPTGTRRELERRVAALETEMENAGGVIARHVIGLRIKQVRSELDAVAARDALRDSERAFVEVAGRYAERKGITADVFADAGVPASVLRRAKLVSGNGRRAAPSSGRQGTPGRNRRRGG